MDNRTANGSNNGKEEGDNNAGHWAGNDTQPLVSFEGNINGVGGIGEVLTEFRQPLQVQRHLEMPGILVQLGHIQCT